MYNNKLKFDGQIEKIDDNILISSLIHISTVIQEINRFLDTGKKIEIKVKAPEKGCFLIQINQIESKLNSLNNLYTKDNIDLAENIITCLIGLITIKNSLKAGNLKKLKFTVIIQ
jgi:hypothetical protein